LFIIRYIIPLTIRSWQSINVCFYLLLCGQVEVWCFCIDFYC